MRVNIEELTKHLESLSSGEFLQFFRTSDGKFMVIHGSTESGIVTSGFGETILEAYWDEPTG